MMPPSANETGSTHPPPRTAEPDAHGQAALILVESILHALVDLHAMTTQQAIDIVNSAEEVKTETAMAAGESKTRMHESLELLKRIGLSLEADIGRATHS